jgi:hypothetical protein
MPKEGFPYFRFTQLGRMAAAPVGIPNARIRENTRALQAASERRRPTILRFADGGNSGRLQTSVAEWDRYRGCS